MFSELKNTTFEAIPNDILFFFTPLVYTNIFFLKLLNQFLDSREDILYNFLDIIIIRFLMISYANL